MPVADSFSSIKVKVPVHCVSPTVHVVPVMVYGSVVSPVIVGEGFVPVSIASLKVMVTLTRPASASSRDVGATLTTVGAIPSVTLTVPVCVLILAVPAASVTTPAPLSATFPVSPVPIPAASVTVITLSSAVPVDIPVPAAFAPPVVNPLNVKSPPATLVSSTASENVISTVLTVTVCALNIAGPAPSVDT